MKNFTSWIKICDKSREFWSKECKQTVRKTRNKRRVYIKDSTTYNWTKYLHVCDKKDKIIDKHKRNDYRKIMRFVDKSNKRLYAIAKWVKNSTIATNTKAIVSRLSNENDVVTTTKKKAKLLFKIHFSSSLTMILNDIVDFNYVNLILDDESLTSREIKRVIKKTISNKTSSLNNISNRVIRNAMKIIDEQIRSLFERCLRDDVQFAHFKRAATILLRKSSNRDYTNLKSYKSIILLNTLNKTLKSIVSKRIRYVVEMHATLSNTQMRIKKQRFVDTVLQLITKKIHTIWSNSKKKITSLLSLNVSRAFDNVSHARLLHNMRKRRMSTLLLNWVKDFLRKRRTTLTIKEYTLFERRAKVNISQSSFLSFILYLFYNVDLLKNCDDIKLRTSIIDFVNDVNILTYNDSTKRNCEKLKKIYRKCERWCETHDSRFEIDKCELIHFSRTSRRHNMQ